MPRWPNKRGRKNPIPKEPGARRSRLAEAILQARRAAGLTQAALGRRVGLTGRAVYRWERDESQPTRRNRAALITALTAVSPEIGARFAEAVASTTAAARGAPPARIALAPAPAAPPQPSGPEALERAVYALADELDLPARRARGALKRLVVRLRAANLGLDGVQGHLEEWIARVE